MTKFALIGDTHFGARNANQVFAQNAEDFFTNEFFPELKRQNITQIVHAGDLFDNRRNLNMVTLTSFRKCFLEPLEKHGITLHVVPGNHDTYFRNTLEVCSINEVLGKHPNVKLYMDPTEIKVCGLTIGMVPWINSSNAQSCLDFIKTTHANFLLGHFEIRGFEMIPGILCDHGMEPDVFNKFDEVWSGHFHTASKKQNIRYLGAPLEFNWSDAHDPKFWWIFDIAKMNIEPIQTKSVLHQKIYYNDLQHSYENFDFEQVKNKFVKVVVEHKKNMFVFDKFLDSLLEKSLNVKIEENLEDLQGENADNEKLMIEDTMTFLSSYVDSVNTNLDKKRLNNLMQTLLREAQAMDANL